MTDVANLLSQFVDELHAGRRPDAGEYIERATSDADRRELAQAIEGVLMLGTETMRHPRDAATGEFLTADERTRVSAIVEMAFSEAGAWPEQLVEARQAAGMTLSELVDATLAAAGVKATPETQGVARRWLSGLETGAKSVFETSGVALRAIAKAVGKSIDDLVPGSWQSASGPTTVAFRADASVTSFNKHLDHIADELAAGMERKPSTGDELESWFSRE